MWTLANITDWSYGGVNHAIEGNGGPHCVAFLSVQRRLLETFIAVLIGVIALCWSWKHLRVPAVPKVERQDRGGKRALLVLMCMIFGMEIAFKFASRTVIYLLNPCHIVTIIQIFLLAAPPTSKLVTVLFRIHLHCIYGAVLALLFPVLNTLLLPMETEVYMLQHVLMLVIPFYLLRTGIGGVYTVEPIRDLSWSVFSLGLLFIYHFIVLHGLGVLTEVNLNSVICPAVSDPFYGVNFRFWALGHQTVLILGMGKVYTLISLWILRAMGTVTFTGEKYVVLATQRVHQLCSICRQGSCSNLKREDLKE